jgi:hypothetical protein
MTTIDLIDVFCCQSIIGIDPIYVFLTIGAQLCSFGYFPPKIILILLLAGLYAVDVVDLLLYGVFSLQYPVQ